MMKLIFLGTSSGVPTASRNQTSVLLNYCSEYILFDCGEGTQRQLLKAGVSVMNITRICISHFHGDHILGLPGLLQTLALNNYTRTLKIYGPRGTKKFIQGIISSFRFVLGINLEIHEVQSSKILEADDFFLYTEKLEHYNCVGYKFQEKDKRKINLKYIKKIGIPRGPLLGQLQQGKSVKWKNKVIKSKDATFLKKGRSIVFIFDTAYAKNAVKLARNADLVICESTYLSDMEKRAAEYKHLTAHQAAEIAKKARVKQLILTHFSQRYKDKQEFLKEAKKVFPNVSLAEDFMKVEI